jgi:UDP-glucose 4-epimerase
MRILVSGGTGYVGAALVRRLVERGDTVAVLSRGHAADTDDVTRVPYTTLDDLAEFCNDWRPEAVVHLAASLRKDIEFSSVSALAAANVILPLHLASAANASGANKYINISTFSSSVDGRTYSPQTLYAATKKACEDLLTYYHQSEALKVCTLCFYDVYGPKQPHDRFLNSLIKAVIQGQPFSMSPGKQEICFLHVEDAIESIVYALETPSCFENPAENIYSVFGPSVYQLGELPQAIAKLLSKPDVTLVHDKPYRKNEIMKFSPRHPLLPGWKPNVSFDDAIKAIALDEMTQ